MGGNDSLLRMIGENVEIDCPSLSKSARANDVLRDKVVRKRKNFARSLAVPASLTIFVVKVLLYFSAYWCQRKFWRTDLDLQLVHAKRSALGLSVVALPSFVLILSLAYLSPACREFTPLLVELYKNLKARGENVEVLFCSNDKSMSQFRECSTSMPWWSLSPVAYSDVQRKLSCYYGIQAIPHLVVVGLDGAVIVNDAVDHVRKDPSGNNFPWNPPPLNAVLPTHYLLSHGITQREPVKALERKYLLLYFSAGWSPACLQFTPHLSEAYRRLKSVRDDFELLFVSSDYDQSAFDAYWKEMEFRAIPFEERDAQNELFTRLGVKGVPTLVVLGPIDAATRDRPVINANARPCIEKPDFMDAFPYAPTRCGDFNHLDENINDLRAIVVFYESGDDHEQSRLRETLTAASEQCRLTALGLYWATESTQMTRTFREALRLGEATLHDDPCMVLLDVPDGGTFYVRRTIEVTIDAIVEFVSSPGERHQL